MEQRMLLIENLHNAMQVKLDQISAQVTEQLRNQNLSEAAHQQVHKELADLRSLAVDVESLKSSSGPRVDKHPDKNLNPGSYSLTKSQWPTWSPRFRRYMNRRHPGLAEKMLQVEEKATPLSPMPSHPPMFPPASAMTS